jgi:diaminohydroxyphosphoribosylaminopyrimidine deaminase/5-amino-6-(5-phosphoribosylamino)uracil reductase
VIAVQDPNPRVRGRGLEYLRTNGVDVAVGTLAEDARRLNRAFFTYITERRPFVTLKAALSLDAMVAERRGARTALTGPESNVVVHRERAEVDAIAVGSETLLVDDPLLTARDVFRERQLTRVVFDRRLRTPTSARALTTLEAGPVVVVSIASQDDQRRAAVDALVAAGAEVLLIEAENPGEQESSSFLRAALERLATRELTSMVVEGGPTLHDACWRAGLVDRVELFVSPRAIGPHGVPWAMLPDGSIASLSDLRAMPVGDDVLIEGYVEHVHGTG